MVQVASRTVLSASACSMKQHSSFSHKLTDPPLSALRKLALLAAIGSFFLASIEASAREWIDSTGTHKIEAEFVSSANGKVWLKTQDGSVITVPLARLSVIDREYVRRQASPQSGSASGIQGGAPAELAAKVRPAIVHVQLGKKEASGFVVDPTGIVITNCQVINGGKPAKISFHDGESVSVAEYLGVDVARDIVVLKVDTGHPLAALSLRVDPPKLGEPAFACGASSDGNMSISPGLVATQETAEQCRAAYEETLGRFRQPTDAWWIRVTSPIDSGNWGGPLVDEKGQVMGINSRTKTDQSLNFAIPCQDIAELLHASRSNEPQNQRNLPSSLSPYVDGEYKYPTFPYHGFPSVNLPSGAPFSFLRVRIPPRWPASQLGDAPWIRTVRRANNDVKSMHAFRDAKLHGPSFLLYDDGSKRWTCDYVIGKRDGDVRLWSKTGELALFAEYVRNGKKGFTCVFQQGLPWLLQEWDANQKKREYLVKWNAGVPTVVEEDAFSMQPAAAESALASKRMSEFEAQFQEEETEAKRDVAEWAREIDRELKQHRTAPSTRRQQGEPLGVDKATSVDERRAFERTWRQAMMGQ